MLFHARAACSVLLSPARSARQAGRCVTRALATVPLFSRTLRAEQTAGRPVVFIHGMFGSSTNFRSIAQACSDALGADRDFYCLDLRNHGQSGHAPTMSYEAMASDIHAFMNDHHLSPGMLVGHSLGGKVAMMTALLYPEIVDKLVVVDVSPVTYDRQMRQANHVLQTMASLPLEIISDRRAADRALQQAIPNASIRGFVLQNLVFTKSSSPAWRINLPAMLENMDVLGEFPHHTLPFKGPTLFIRGVHSNYVTPDHYPEMTRLFPSHEVVSLLTDHWVHADDPKAFVDALTAFIRKN